MNHIRLTSHFHDRRQGESITRSELPRSVREVIWAKERVHGRSCRKIWWFRNPQGEDYVFGAFCRQRDRLIVTLAAYIPFVGWRAAR